MLFKYLNPENYAIINNLLLKYSKPSIGTQLFAVTLSFDSSADVHMTSVSSRAWLTLTERRNKIYLEFQCSPVFKRYLRARTKKSEVPLLPFLDLWEETQSPRITYHIKDCGLFPGGLDISIKKTDSAEEIITKVLTLKATLFLHELANAVYTGRWKDQVNEPK